MTHPTPAQITRLYTLAGAAGLGRAGAKDEMFARYGVESSKDLSPRQYENFTTFLEGMGRAKSRESKRRGVVGAHGDAPGPEKLHTLADCEALLRNEWPDVYARDQELAAHLVEVVDCWRLCRLSGAMSMAIAATALQVLRKLDLRDVRQAVGAYLTGYTTKPERYLLAMVRNGRRDRTLAERKSNRLEAEEQKQLHAAQHLAAEVVKAAGRPPSCPPVRRSLGEGGCPFCDGKARVYYDRGDGVFTDVPCPWCPAGRQHLVEQITAGKRYDHRNWDAIRDQLEERLAKRAIADETARHPQMNADEH